MRLEHAKVVAQPDKVPAPPDASDVSAFGFAPVSTDGGQLEIDDSVVAP